MIPRFFLLALDFDAPIRFLKVTGTSTIFKSFSIPIIVIKRVNNQDFESRIVLTDLE